MFNEHLFCHNVLKYNERLGGGWIHQHIEKKPLFIKYDFPKFSENTFLKA